MNELVSLSDLAITIRCEIANVEKSLIDFAESTMRLAHALRAAREFFSDNSSFGKWMSENGLDVISHQDRAALINMAINEELSKEVLLETRRRSWQLVWVKEIQPKIVTSASNNAVAATSKPVVDVEAIQTAAKEIAQKEYEEKLKTEREKIEAEAKLKAESEVKRKEKDEILRLAQDDIIKAQRAAEDFKKQSEEAIKREQKGIAEANSLVAKKVAERIAPIKEENKKLKQDNEELTKGFLALKESRIELEKENEKLRIGSEELVLQKMTHDLKGKMSPGAKVRAEQGDFRRLAEKIIQAIDKTAVYSDTRINGLEEFLLQNVLSYESTHEKLALSMDSLAERAIDWAEKIRGLKTKTSAKITLVKE